MSATTMTMGDYGMIWGLGKNALHIFQGVRVNINWLCLVHGRAEASEWRRVGNDKRGRKFKVVNYV